jgi:predicted nucleotide-binding protein
MDADVFITYAREDRVYADAIAMALQARGLRVWWDANLLPGLPFEQQILETLRKAPIVVAVLSPTSIRSEWVGAEIQYAMEDRLLVVPILVGGLQPERLPPRLAPIQALILDESRAKESAAEIADQIGALLRQVPRAEVREDTGVRLALASAETARAASEVAPTGPPDSIFVVHGHDDGMLGAVMGELERLGVKAVVLRRVRTSDDHLFAKFKAIASQARHAIVLLSADDVGAAFREFVHPAGGAARLGFRARQNVILELGYFYGKLGEECVFVFRKAAPESERIAGSFEEPSDLAGRIFEDFSPEWPMVLREKLQAAGFALAC